MTISFFYVKEAENTFTKNRGGGDIIKTLNKNMY